MQILSVSSGSSGNAYIVEHEGSQLLIDCGISYSAVKKYLTDGLVGILVTHDHTDHISGLRTLLKHCDASVYANSMTAEVSIAKENLPEERFACFENTQEFDVGPFNINPFSIPHDTPDPVGYLVKAGGITYFHGTDIGTPTESIGHKLAEADVAVLESNHDLVMLNTSGRAQSLIQRIQGPRGHLSNEQSCGLVQKFASPKLKMLALAHLSRDCNAPILAETAMRNTLASINRTDIQLKVLGVEIVQVI